MVRRILIGFAILFLLFVAGVVFLYYHKYRPSIREAEARAETERKLLQPRVVKGEGEFEKRAFYSSEGLGAISQVLVGWPADHEGTDLAVVASQGADFVDFSGQVKKRVRFSIPQSCPVTVARIELTGEYGYLTREESLGRTCDAI